MSHRIEHAVDVSAPVSRAYEQWTRFHEFPRFMRHVESVRRLDDRLFHWRVNLGGAGREFVTEIVEQVPDQRIAWRSVDGPLHHGAVTFHRIGPHKSRVMLQLELEPDGALERLGAFVGVPEIDVRRDMARFAAFVARGDTGEPDGGQPPAAAQPSLRHAPPPGEPDHAE